MSHNHVEVLKAERATLQRSLAEADAILAELEVPYSRLNRAYWTVNDHLVAATRPNVIRHDAAAKLARRRMYDERQQASARRWPVKKKFRETTAWRKAILPELERVTDELAALPPPRVVRLGAPPGDPFERAKTAWMASRGLTAAPPVAGAFTR